mgnify:CR=1 FL=1
MGEALSYIFKAIQSQMTDRIGGRQRGWKTKHETMLAKKQEPKIDTSTFLDVRRQYLMSASKQQLTIA